MSIVKNAPVRQANVDDPVEPSKPPSCQDFSWCWGHDLDGAHFGMDYTPAELDDIPADANPDDYEFHRVGVGVLYDEVHGKQPAVVIHIHGGPYDHDADARLRIHDASELLRQLEGAIRRASHTMLDIMPPTVVAGYFE